MRTYIIVMLGGALGSLLRFVVSKILPVFNVYSFPWPTFTVNIVGCFLAGLITSTIKKQSLTDDWYLLTITGFMGGFTTFSAFSLEILQYLQNEKWGLGILYISLSLVVSIIALAGGWWLGNR